MILSKIASYLLYVSVFAAASVCMHYGRQYKSRLFIVFAILLPVLLASLRYNVGTDYISYVNIYDKLSTLSLPQYINQDIFSHEFGFFALIKLSKILTDSYVLMFSVSSLITISFIYLGLKKSEIKHVTLGYFLALLIFFPLSLNGVRQAIAASIFFYASMFIANRKLVKYLLLVCFASLFHSSVLFLLPLYLLAYAFKSNKSSLSKKNLRIVVLILISALLFYFIDYVMKSIFSISYFVDYAKYTTIATTHFMKYGVLAQGALITISYTLFNRLTKVYEYAHYLIFFVTLEFILLTVGYNSILLTRMSMYFLLFNAVLIPLIADVFHSKRGRNVLYLLAVLYGLVIFTAFSYRLAQHNIFPYTFISGVNL
jgi:hypothetical protein